MTSGCRTGREKTHDIPLRRLPSIRDSITLIWLVDSHLSARYDDEHISRLNYFDNCFLVRYRSASKCMKYLKQARPYEHIILIVNISGIDNESSIASGDISRFAQYDQVHSIFILCSSNTSDIQDATIKPTHLFDDFQSMFVKLQDSIKEIQEDNDLLFTSFNTREKAMRDLRHELGPFVWNHSHRVILQAMPYNSSEARQQMLFECRARYRGDLQALTMIDEFERTYNPMDAICWYTRPCFLYRMINRALRSEDNLAQYTFRYFPVDMCTRLEETSLLTKTRYRTLFRVYRGTKISRDEVEKLRVGMLVAPNGFFSSSLSLDVAQRFIDVDSTTNGPLGRSRDDRRQFALLEINIEPNIMSHITVADISQQSFIPDEREMIFNLGTTFTITQITYDADVCLWRIQMVPSLEVAQLSRDYSAYIRKRLTEIKPVLLFGSVLVDMSSDHINALRYFHRLLHTTTADDEDRPNIYFHLARVYRYIGKYQQAITYYRCAQLLQRRRLPAWNFDYGRTLTNLGVVYSEIGDSTHAVILHTRAMAILRSILPEEHIEIGHISHRLAYAYWQERQYERGHLLASNSLSFFKLKMPANHPGQAQALHTMGLIEHGLGHREQAIECFKQALCIRESLQAIDAPAVAYECYELSLMHAERDEQRETALEYAQRALSICQAKLPKNHTRCREIAELVERLSIRPNV